MYVHYYTLDLETNGSNTVTPLVLTRNQNAGGVEFGLWVMFIMMTEGWTSNRGQGKVKPHNMTTIMKSFDYSWSRRGGDITHRMCDRKNIINTAQGSTHWFFKKVLTEIPKNKSAILGTWVLGRERWPTQPKCEEAKSKSWIYCKIKEIKHDIRNQSLIPGNGRSNKNNVNIRPKGELFCTSRL